MNQTTPVSASKLVQLQFPSELHPLLWGNSQYLNSSFVIVCSSRAYLSRVCLVSATHVSMTTPRLTVTYTSVYNYIYTFPFCIQLRESRAGEGCEQHPSTCRRIYSRDLYSSLFFFTSRISCTSSIEESSCKVHSRALVPLFYGDSATSRIPVY